MLIGDIVTGNARRIPDRDALIIGDARFTWSQHNERINRLANGLIGLGVEPGSRVAYVLDNCHQLVELYFAIAKIGAVSVPIVPDSVGREIAFIANDVRARVLVAGPEYCAAVESVRDTLDSVEILAGIGEDHPFAHGIEALQASSSAAEPGVAVDPDGVYAIKYTSGTTGFPKGCMRTHRQHLTNILLTLAYVPHYDDDRATVSSPLSAGFGISMLVNHACRGMTTYLLPEFDVVRLLETIERERITIAYAIGTTFARFAMHPEIENFDLSSVRRFTGSNTNQDTRECMSRLRKHKTFRGGFFNAYGSSEAGGYVTFHHSDEMEHALNDRSVAHRLQSVGREAQFCHIDCVDDELNPLPPDEVGEMVIRSPSTFSGYWNLPEETAAVLRDGRLVTGDLIRKDEDGYIYLCGRKRDMIKSGGLSVFPAEIERVIASHEKVAEVAVTGIPDARWGEKVVAFVVGRSQCSDREILEYCAGRLAGYKRPKEVVFVDELPRNASGKVAKLELKKSFA